MCYVVTQVEGDLLSKIREVANSDLKYQQLAQRIHESRVRRFSLSNDGIVIAKGGRPYIPAIASLRRDLMRESHDTP